MKRFIIILTLSFSIVFTQSAKKKKRGKNKITTNDKPTVRKVFLKKCSNDFI